MYNLPSHHHHPSAAAASWPEHQPWRSVALPSLSPPRERERERGGGGGGGGRGEGGGEREIERGRERVGNDQRANGLTLLFPVSDRTHTQ